MINIAIGLRAFRRRLASISIFARTSRMLLLLCSLLMGFEPVIQQMIYLFCQSCNFGYYGTTANSVKVSAEIVAMEYSCGSTKLQKQQRMGTLTFEALFLRKLI